ncbi:MAG: BatA domain-containing protein [Pyrinomonadaceae bacterium]
MIFLAPFTLLSLALVALPIAVHLLSRRSARRVDFPSLRYLRETPSFRLRPRRLRQPLSLALRSAALAFLIAGLARPLLLYGTDTTRTTHVILLDASLSMDARHRVAAAKEQARNLIDKLKARDRIALVAFSDKTFVLAAPTADRRLLLQSLENYRTENSRADYVAGFAAAAGLLQREPPGASEIDVVSDFQQSNLEIQEQSLPHETHARVVAFPVGNQVERNAFLIDESVRARERSLELSATEIVSADDGQSGVQRFHAIDAPVGARPGIEWQTESNSQITGRMIALSPDNFDADDERFFAFNAPRPLRVLLINDGSDASLYLRAALETAIVVNDKGLRSPVFDERRDLPNASDLKAYSHIVLALHGVPHANDLNAIREYAESGGGVWLWLGRDVSAAAWSAAAQTEAGGVLPFTGIAAIPEDQNLNFIVTDRAALPLRSMSEKSLDALHAVRISKGYAVMPRERVATLARWSKGGAPCFVSTRVGAGTVLLTATAAERAASDLGQSAALPALASSVLRAADYSGEPLSQTIGEPVRLGVAPEAAIKIVDAENKEALTTARSLIATPSMFFRKPGIYRVEWANESKFLAFNAPVAESTRALAEPFEIEKAFRNYEGTGETVNAFLWRDAAERKSGAWRYLFAAAFLLLVAELFVARRLRERSHTSQDALL